MRGAVKKIQKKSVKISKGGGGWKKTTTNHNFHSGIFGTQRQGLDFSKMS